MELSRDLRAQRLAAGSESVQSPATLRRKRFFLALWAPMFWKTGLQPGLSRFRRGPALVGPAQARTRNRVRRASPCRMGRSHALPPSASFGGVNDAFEQPPSDVATHRAAEGPCRRTVGVLFLRSRRWYRTQGLGRGRRGRAPGVPVSAIPTRTVDALSSALSTRRGGPIWTLLSAQLGP
jgi:hypothetical protein